jgi:serine/threonine-protein kinase
MSTNEPRELPARYQLITKLGQGGMARVLLMLARGRAGVNKLLVVKELLPDLEEDPEFLAMFLDEARLATRLNHPNVVQTYEVTDEGSHPLIVMEYLEGQSLTAVINRIGREEMPISVHVHILTQVLSGLHHAHELCDFDGTPLGVVHRDVSPQNVFVTYEGQVKLVDFGIAKGTTSPGRTRTGVFKGKVAYASPEQTLAAPLDRRSDVFAIGVMLWEALARQRITQRELDVAVMQRRASGEDPHILAVAPGTPDELARICAKAMARDPADRFASAEALRAALEAYAATTERVSAHDLAELMQSVFAADRAKIRGLIDARVKALTAEEPPSPATPSPPSSAPPPVEVTPSTSTPAADGASKSTARAASLTPPLPAKSGRLRGLLAPELIALLLGTIALVQLSRRGAHEASAGVDAGPIAAATPGSPDASSLVATTVDVTITVDPPEAHVILDGVALATNPFHTSAPRSSQAHLVRAAVPGFTAEERLIVFEREVDVQLKLSPAPSASAEAPAAWRGQRPAVAAVRGPQLAPEVVSIPAATTPPLPGGALPVVPRKQPRTIDSTF